MKRQSGNTKSFSEVERLLEVEPDLAFARRARIIFQNLKLSEGEKVLDVGCGRGFYLKAITKIFPKAEIFGIDKSQKYLKVARKFLDENRAELVLGDAKKLPFKDNFFDRIIASEVLEHIEDDQKAISEIYRVLRPGEVGIITVPNRDYPFLWDPLNWVLEKLFQQHIPSRIWWLAGIWADHQRLYDKNELTMKLKKVGFKIEKIWQATYCCLPFSHFLLYGIGKNLVEKGYLQEFNRFNQNIRPSFLSRIFLWLARKVDGLNKKRTDLSPSVNIIAKIRKL